MEANQKDSRDSKDPKGGSLDSSSGDTAQNVENYIEIPDAVIADNIAPISSNSSENYVNTRKSDGGKTSNASQLESKSSTSTKEACTSSSESCTTQSNPPSQQCSENENITNSVSTASIDNNGAHVTVSSELKPGCNGNRSELQQEGTTADSNLGARNVKKAVQLVKEVNASTSTNAPVAQEFEGCCSTTTVTETILNTIVSNTQTDSNVRKVTITSVNKTQCSTKKGLVDKLELGEKVATQNKTQNNTNPVHSKEESTSSSIHSKGELQKCTTEIARTVSTSESPRSAEKAVSNAKPGSKRKSKSASNELAGSSTKKKKRKSNSEKKREEENTEETDPLPAPVDLDEEWNIVEKKRLLEALKTDRGRRWWGRLASKVITKNVDQVKHYTKILRAKANSTTPIHLEEIDNPLQAWIVACERLIDCQDDIDAKCIPQVMTIAAVEPSSTQETESLSGPNYGKIYTFLSGILRGQPIMFDLSPLDAKVVLELLHNLETKVSSADASEQVNFLRTKFKTINKELEQEQIVFAIEELKRDIQRDEMNARISPSNTSASGVLIVGDMTNEKKIRKNPKKIVVQGSMQSSLNPINVPVSLLNLTTKK